MREQLLWSYGPRTRFVGKHPYADILGAQPVEPKPEYATVSARYRAVTLKAIKDNPGIQTKRLSRLLRTIEPTMARSTVQRLLQTLERNGQIRSETDTEPRHGGGNYYIWYAT